MKTKAKDQWEIEMEERIKEREVGMSKLTSNQKSAIEQTHKTLEVVLMMLNDCQDLYISDVRKLSECFFQIKNEFNIDEG